MILINNDWLVWRPFLNIKPVSTIMNRMRGCGKNELPPRRAMCSSFVATESVKIPAIVKRLPWEGVMQVFVQNVETCGWPVQSFSSEKLDGVLSSYTKNGSISILFSQQDSWLPMTSRIHNSFDFGRMLASFAWMQRRWESEVPQKIRGVCAALPPEILYMIRYVRYVSWWTSSLSSMVKHYDHDFIPQHQGGWLLSVSRKKS